jgi:hypothetical protein
MNTTTIINELINIKTQALQTAKAVDAVLKQMDPPKKKKGLTEEERLRIRNGFAKRNLKTQIK